MNINMTENQNHISCQKQKKKPGKIYYAYKITCVDCNRIYMFHTNTNT